MKATQLLHERGQSLWLDNITRDLLGAMGSRMAANLLPQEPGGRRGRRERAGPAGRREKAV